MASSSSSPHRKRTIASALATEEPKSYDIAAGSSSRKRPSDTPVAAASSSSSLLLSQNGKTKLRVRLKRFHGVAKWTWNAGDEDDVCAICQSAFEGAAPGVKYPGDESPLVWGKCGHALHLQCVSKWVNASRNTCPICRREWDFGANEPPPSDS